VTHIIRGDENNYERLRKQYENLLEAVTTHHAQKADDRCIEDDDKLYAAAGLPPCDRRVGSQADMLANCARFVMNRCQGGGWPSYAKVHAALTEIKNMELPQAMSTADRISREIIRQICERGLQP